MRPGIGGAAARRRPKRPGAGRGASRVELPPAGLERRLARAMRSRLPTSPGGRHILVAVSGGADSVALLAALRDLAPSLGLRLSVAHLNHRIRGRAADEDAAFVRRLARSMGLPCAVGRADVPRLARRRGLSLEAAARLARYAFLGRAARAAGADAVATAHTADDQAESVLLRLARGAGLAGIAGIAPAADLGGARVIRPLLDVTRAQVLDFLRRRGLGWREDASNRDPAYLRNRVRHEILPLLESRLNPSIREALRRTAEIAREDNAWLDALAAPLLAQCAAGARELDAAALRALPAAARRRVLRLWLASRGAPAEDVDFDAIARVERLASGAGGSRDIELGGGRRVCRQYGRLRLDDGRGGDARRAGPFRAAIRVPGVTLLRAQGLRIETRIAPGIARPKGRRPGQLPAEASLGRSAVGRRRVVVRSWQPGDRIRPLGMAGSKKIQDVFVDGKVPAERRPLIPIFECGGEIVWLPGYRVARGWEVADAREPAVQIRVREAAGM